MLPLKSSWVERQISVRGSWCLFLNGYGLGHQIVADLSDLHHPRVVDFTIPAKSIGIADVVTHVGGDVSKRLPRVLKSLTGIKWRDLKTSGFGAACVIPSPLGVSGDWTWISRVSLTLTSGWRG